MSDDGPANEANEGASEDTKVESVLAPGDLTADELARTSTADLGGSLAYTSVTNASVKFTTSANGIAWIGSKSAPHGVANVYVDGRFARAVDTYAATTVTGKVLFEIRFGSTGTHTVTIVDAGTAGRPYVDADAFVVTK